MAPAGSIDDLCVNTIRTLSIDAVQKANSGHPGTPMAMAPVVYTLWQNILRFDPADPIWPNRDRFVLSSGHASMLLYSLLHLTGVKSVDARIRAARHAFGCARRYQAFPPARQPMPGPPGISPDLGGRDHDRPARPGRRQQRRHGDRRRLAGPRIQPARLRHVRLRRLRAVRRRRHDGGRRAARPASLAGHLQASQSLLDLRQQPHHDRGPHRPRLQRGRRRRVSSAMAGRCMRVSDANDRERDRRRDRRAGAPTTGRR